MNFGLIGKSLSHSFSKNYFEAKFKKEKLNHSYHNFELAEIGDFPKLINEHESLKGLNVTIPYKESIIPYLDGLSTEAKEIGAVNTLQLSNTKIIGHNTDWIGFYHSIDPLLKAHHQRSLILGTGGASKAVAYALSKLGMTYLKVSRYPAEADCISYEQANSILDNHFVIINTTPLGTFPTIDSCPDLDFEHMTEKHFIFDLVYNPAETKLLQKARYKGAHTANGLKMLQLQAEKSWAIWNEL